MTGRVGVTLAKCSRDGHQLVRMVVLDVDWWEADESEDGGRWLVSPAGSVMIEAATPASTLDDLAGGWRARTIGTFRPVFGSWDPMEEHDTESVSLVCPRCAQTSAADVDDLLRVRQRRDTPLALPRIPPARPYGEAH